MSNSLHSSWILFYLAAITKQMQSRLLNITQKPRVKSTDTAEHYSANIQCIPMLDKIRQHLGLVDTLLDIRREDGGTVLNGHLAKSTLSQHLQASLSENNLWSELPVTSMGKSYNFQYDQ